MSSVYSYIMTVDGGFAPNPFHGVFTLACCKPVIRRTAEVGDWIVGLSPKRLGHGIVYAMRVGERLSFEQYWHDERFREKRPRFAADADRVGHRGDNAYEPLAGGGFRQHRCAHSHRDGSEDPRGKRRDLCGLHVLVADRHAYFGASTLALPQEFDWLIAGRGHRRFRVEDGGRMAGLLAFLEALPAGMHGRPRNWPADDDSWRGHARPEGVA